MSQSAAAFSSTQSAPQREAVACPVCDSTHHTVMYKPWTKVEDPVQLYGAASGVVGTQQIVRCNDCGMIYENPRFPESVILQGYLSSDEAGHDSQFPMRVKSFLKALERHADLLPPKGAKVLDIGTAGGAFLDAATSYGYDAHGMEPSQFLVDSGKKRGLQIEQGTIDAHTFAPASFDMICLWDVIEHIVDPKKALQEINRLLKPGGILLLNYPDIGTWQAKLAGRRFWWILSVHLHHFARHSISDICARTGFKVFSFKRYWQILEFGYLVKMAIVYKLPLANLMDRLLPGFIKSIPIPYYASQTTALARKAT